ncbi:MAG: hypothetical protein A2Z49_02025 [Chloroflexi bacterium RBG_19FT_COMBO_56_12]|nr:MAG: hypothetical protein A2Z49_02025 [Chloroflexi bacterium RBG_19FT_COMBO_56_12]
MHKSKLLMLFINLIGGTAVLGSYAWGALTHPGAADVLWGGVPQGIRSFYTAGMFLAASGYFAFSYFILFRLPPKDTQVAGRFGFGVFNAIYAAILIPSGLWMPLTFLALDQSSPVLVWVVRLDLALVAVASLSLLFTLISVRPRQPVWAHRLAVIGVIGFCFQTVILDAVVWGANFGV